MIETKRANMLMMLNIPITAALGSSRSHRHAS